MQELEKILERGEIIAIEELEEENERCNRSCEGCCSEMEEGKCYCKDALVISAIKKLIERIELCGADHGTEAGRSQLPIFESWGAGTEFES